MADRFCVKVKFLPAGIMPNDLAQRFGVQTDQISIVGNETEKYRHGWVSGFTSESDADNFIRRWDRTRISGATIRCTVAADNRKRSPQHQNTTTNERIDTPDACRNGGDCYRYGCRFDHPLEWVACKSGRDCEAFYCQANHPPGRRKPCPKGSDCDSQSSCYYLHSKEEEEACSDGSRCRDWDCSKWHPKNRPIKCQNAGLCPKYTCSSIHPRTWNPCIMEETCPDLSCECIHPTGRPKLCEQKGECDNYYCDRLHPNDRDPCPDGSECNAASCPHRLHPRKRQDVTASISSLKTREQREHERRNNALPILKARDKFCQDLKKQRVLIVMAETGSGKSTQLPQYAAEYFGGLVVCTQPRVIAAISLARRVAQEYDGSRVGYSVGYRVGVTSTVLGYNRVPGDDIMYMTDGAFIQESIDYQLLSNIRVLIIDEAHERSLNTDIVMGIAKQLLARRPDDFYVVISSATINPEKFLRFFNQDEHSQLKVEGKVHQVTVKYVPSPEKQIEQTAVKVLRSLYDKHEGTTLVFLPGQREIEDAITLFSTQLPENCVALPLYSTLSPEDQERVLQFDKGENGEKRMVVFTTNIAETSLTIDNTRLIIDSGLAREPQYDFKSRLTTMETRLICQASAEQRKGRAGRTAPGHCVRLYDWNDVTREEIEPALLHSSIDLTVLQLIDLGYDPLTFPFLDQPPPGTIEDSLDLLKSLRCIDENHQINNRGSLFVRLNFDPRYSALLVDVYLEHEPILDLITTIVAILTAPGSLFLTGATDEERRESLRSIGQAAKPFQSDLLFYASFYREWRERGQLPAGTTKCPICHTQCVIRDVCRPCRASFSTMRGLNNRILCLVENVCKITINSMQSCRWNLRPAKITVKTEEEIIGEKLLEHFSGNLCKLVSEKKITSGARLMVSRKKTFINKTSCYYQHDQNPPDFICMWINQQPNDYCIIDRLHPVQPGVADAAANDEYEGEF